MLLFLLLSLFPLKASSGLQVSITNLNEARGDLYVAVYDQSGNFLSLEKYYTRRILPVRQTGKIDISFDELPPGQYAISCFHDLNGNGKMDTNLVGIPTEPYGFSNNARPKFRAPYWQEAVFYWNSGGNSPQIKLERW